MTSRSRPDPTPVLLARPVADAAVARSVDDTGALARSLCAHLGSAAPPDAPRVRPGRARWTVEAAATVVLRDLPGTPSPLEGLADVLVGWERRHARGRVERLEARRDGRVVEASYVVAEGVLVLTVVSAPVPVTREQSRRLRAR